MPTTEPTPVYSVDDFLQRNFPYLTEEQKKCVIETMARREDAARAVESGPSRGPLDVIGDITRSSYTFAGEMQHQYGVVSPGAYAKAMIGAMNAAKELLEFLQAQDSMDLWKDKPQVKELYTRVISVGLASLFGKNIRDDTRTTG